MQSQVCGYTQEYFGFKPIRIKDQNYLFYKHHHTLSMHRAGSVTTHSDALCLTIHSVCSYFLT